MNKEHEDCEHRYVNKITGRCIICGEKVELTEQDKQYGK